MYYVVCSTGALYGILLSYIEQNGWFKGRTFRISIDTLNHDSVETMLAEFGMNDHSIYAFDGSEVATEKELTEFHTALFRAGKTDFAVTGLTSAYHSLRAANIPAYRLAITKTAIHAALRLVELEARNLLIRDMQLCVGVVWLHYPENTQSSRVSDYEYRRRRLAFTNRFVDYCEDIKASIRIDDDNTFVFFTNRGVFTRFVEQGIPIPFLAEKQKNFDVSMGLATGHTANAAELSAYEALNQAIRLGSNQCVMITEDGEMLILNQSGDRKKLISRLNDVKMIELADKAGVKPESLTKLGSCAAKNTNHTFTAYEYAKELSITLRSARRLIQKLEDAGVICEVGTERSSIRGRPRRVYRLL